MDETKYYDLKRTAERIDYNELNCWWRNYETYYLVLLAAKQKKIYIPCLYHWNSEGRIISRTVVNEAKKPPCLLFDTFLNEENRQNYTFHINSSFNLISLSKVVNK